MRPESAHDACAQPSQARVRLALTESEAAKIGLLDRWIAARKRKTKRDARKVGVSMKLQAVLDQLETIARTEHWSQRKLAAKAGLPESTLRKIKRGQTDPRDYLPKLQSAVARLQSN